MAAYNKRISLTLPRHWCIANKKRSAELINIVADSCRSVFPEGFSLETSDSRSSVMLIATKCFDNSYIEKIVLGIVKDALSESADAVAAKVIVEDIVECRHNNSDSVLSKIESLVGSDEFKALAREIAAIAPQIIKHSTQTVFANQSYLFSINDGCGLSTYTELLAALMSECGLFTFRNEPFIIEETIRQKTPTDAPDAYMGKLAKLKNDVDAKRGGRLYCIDISEWIGKTDEKDFRAMLSLVEDNTQNNIFVFRVPFIEGDVLESVKDSLSDILFIKENVNHVHTLWMVVQFVQHLMSVHFVKKRNISLMEQNVKIVMQRKVVKFVIPIEMLVCNANKTITQQEEIVIHVCQNIVQNAIQQLVFVQNVKLFMV